MLLSLLLCCRCRSSSSLSSRNDTKPARPSRDPLLLHAKARGLLGTCHARPHPPIARCRGRWPPSPRRRGDRQPGACTQEGREQRKQGKVQRSRRRPPEARDEANKASWIGRPPCPDLAERVAALVRGDGLSLSRGAESEEGSCRRVDRDRQLRLLVMAQTDPRRWLCRFLSN